MKRTLRSILASPSRLFHLLLTAHSTQAIVALLGHVVLCHRRRLGYGHGFPVHRTHHLGSYSTLPCPPNPRLPSRHIHASLATTRPVSSSMQPGTVTCSCIVPLPYALWDLSLFSSFIFRLIDYLGNRCNLCRRAAVPHVLCGHGVRWYPYSCLYVIRSV